jgi:DtxR family transcriptional regulator, Mn-dependent transcriptional regulator
MLWPMPAPDSHALSISAENYAKAIYTLTRGEGETASTTDLARRLDLSPGSISTMIKRLDDAGLAEHVPYRGVRLTPEGERVALRIIRRHRLLELFLVTTLDIPWEDVHRHAESLEHAVSDELIEIIAKRLGDPLTDPHGDPIPTRDLEVDERVTQSLADLEPGGTATLARVSDADPDMLRFLAKHRIAIGSQVEMIDQLPFDGPFRIRVGGRIHSLGPALARAIRVAG